MSESVKVMDKKNKAVNPDAHELIKNIAFNAKQSSLTLSTIDSKL